MSDPFIGEMRLFAGNFAPRGWALCEGQLLAISQNDALFSLLGTIYGGDGRTTFGLPDLRGRVPVHQGTGPGLPDARIGQTGGAETVTLTSSQVPAHSHAVRASAALGTGSAPGNALLTATGPVNSYGSGAPDLAMAADALSTQPGGPLSHDNMAPFLAVNTIIALFGIYPSRS